MNIMVKRSGEYPDSRQGWFTGSVGLNEDDLKLMAVEGKVPGYRVHPDYPDLIVEEHDWTREMSLVERFKTLRRVGEIMMVQWFAEEGLMSPAQAKAEIARLNG